VAIRRILLDTNAYSAFMNNLDDAVDVIRHAPAFFLNSVVLGEMLSGFAAGSREEKNLRELSRFLGSPKVKLVSIDYGTAEKYALVYRKLRKKGHPIPTNDMWVAASALQHGFAVFTFDKHFEVVQDLDLGTRLSDFLF
jgi:predicted nucleic acid-binding protein